MTRFDLTKESIFTSGNHFVGRGRPVDENPSFHHRPTFSNTDSSIELINRQRRLQGMDVVDKAQQAFFSILHRESKIAHPKGFPQLRFSLDLNAKSEGRKRSILDHLRDNLRGLSIPGTLRPMRDDFSRLDDDWTDCYRCGRLLSARERFIRQSMTCHACDNEMENDSIRNRTLIQQLHVLREGNH